MKNSNKKNSFTVKRMLLNLGLPLFLFLAAVVTIGAGCQVNYPPTETYYIDADEDGFGDHNHEGKESTDDLTLDGYALNNEDCDDSNENIHPDATEIPDNGIDEDCNGEDEVTGSGGATN